MKTNALTLFHRPPERLNCAQAVLHGYQAVTGDTSIPLADFAPYGSGRAPDGTCGALYAACVVAPQAAESLRQDFAARTGATRCFELKNDRRVPCVECVGLAAELLHCRQAGPPASA